MVFRMFVAGTFENTQEREQMESVRRGIQGVYERIPDEWCCLFVDLYVNGRQIDGVVLKKDKLIILEMKDYHGRIIADLAEGHKWRVIPPQGDSWDPEDNPFEQVRKQRGAIASGLESIPEFNFPVQDETAPFDGPRPSSRFICGWVVLPDDVDLEIVNNDKRNDKWFKILRINEVASEIPLQTSPPDLRVKSEDLAYLFAEKVNAKERKPDDWLIGSQDEFLLRHGGERSLVDPQYFSEWRSRIESLDDSKDENVRLLKTLLRDIDFGRFRFRALDEMLRSQSSDKIAEAAKMIATLGLSQYAKDLISLTGGPNPNVRYEALSALQHFDHNEDITLPLLRLIRDESSYVRELAFNLLVSEGSSSATPELIQMIEGGNEEEVLRAIRILEEIGDERAVDSLIQLSENYSKRFPQSLFRKTLYGKPLAPIISALGKIGSQIATGFILKYLGDENLKDVAIDALGDIGDPRGKSPLVQLLKSEDDIYILKALVRALGKIGGEDIVPYLHRYLQTDDEELFIYTIGTLKTIGSIKSFEPVWEYFSANRYQQNFKQFRLFELLTSIDRAKTEARLIPLIKQETDRELRLAAIAWIWGVASRSSLDILLSLLGDRDLHYQAAGAIAQVARREQNKNDIIRQIKDLLESPSDLLREAAVLILTEIEDESATTMLAQFVNDRSETVRKTVAERLRISVLKGNDQSIPPLIGMIADESPKVRVYALSLLWDLTFPPGYGILLAAKSGLPFPNSLALLLKSEDPEVRRKAIHVAAHFWGDESLENISDLTTDGSPEVRITLVTALAKIGTAECLTSLEVLARDEDKAVAERAKTAYRAVQRQLRGESSSYPYFH